MPIIQIIPVKIADTPITQRHPIVSPTKPPTIGPRMGPMNGAAAKMDIARPRCREGNMSAMTPPALVKGEDPKAPARNRVTMSVVMFLLPTAPALKAVIAPYVPEKIICRPYSSERGAHSRGPMAKPSTKSANPSVATSSLQ